MRGGGVRGHRRMRPPSLAHPASDDETPDPSPVRPAWANDIPNTPDYVVAGRSDAAAPRAAAVTPPGVSPPGRQGVDESTVGSVVMHDLSDDGPTPPWKGLQRPETESRLTGRATGSTVTGLTTSARHAAMHRARQAVLKLDVSTQVALPSSDAERAYKKAADAMVAEVEEELEAVTAERDAARRELQWYKGELGNKSVLLQEARDAASALRAEVSQLRRQLHDASSTTGSLPVPGARDSQPPEVPPAWWAVARRQLLDDLHRANST
uniref:Uncharacterized protein n=1 Tax=Neobodo designis TaxID=312471 RepID=A0A7S1PKX9_NEODS|mmetsp:Transcript_10928/g.33817  ORF Transcript_10928/g.33817 Transcript_10928/m.33817 type:complete len:267 (+) Transcript_10928:43-843(+)|eukprot:CAMPEP_0174853070 /NCGR_PEP_ID=MMETSP1114-20130205/27347_1 /TAXON_ID=312471 /ORGANISM="Neobodo designis, Strain CCAP 1951/1" /LENGTH=266 /DNA_ID=CAMNT_0016087691 /DNA_START=43 /DNA_END=843 /DNA_ORIENTATION=+